MTKTNISWKSTTDTEVILQLLEFYTFEETLKLLQGMFAISIGITKKTVYIWQEIELEKNHFITLLMKIFLFLHQN